VGDLLDVVHQREQLPLRAHLAFPAQREAAHPLVLNICKRRHNRGDAAAVDPSPLTPIVSQLCRSGPQPQPAVHVLYVLSSNCAASRARGSAPAPHARERPLRRRGLSLALSHPRLAPVPGAASSCARSRVVSFQFKRRYPSAAGEWRHRMTGSEGALPPCPRTTAAARARRQGRGPFESKLCA
jgi:hypothetical protein